ncbi:peptidoglycan-binding protein [Lysobacter sp. Root690]|uniref:peptidoglycan-binding protein n=1 Tax=Lysobacter sp. Root690 TaxID=1736588 RepID=UPI0006FADEAF|nr:peptidoglycan-binding protein [Lysobacter sp. Root690]KRB04009.1 peptidoglycan-binding protein [Lysobacter sp. Root690]
MARDYSRTEVLGIIEREAAERNIPRDDFMRFAYIETGGSFNEQASRGAAGAKGLFQFVPSTADAYGIRGRELDAVANTDAAARLYLDNRNTLVNRHERDGRPYLSGKPEPDGLDMYMAHQQGGAGYRSIQSAIATGSFSRDDTRSNILNNVSSRDFERVTGHKYSEFSRMSDRDMATTFTQYWDTKFDRVAIPEKGIAPITDNRQQTQTAPTQTQTAPSQTQTQTTPAQTQTQAQTGAGISLTAAHDLSVKYDNVKYAMSGKYPGVDGKHPDQGYVDCSGWVATMQNATMNEINKKAGREIYGKEDKFNLGNDGAAMIVDKAQQRSGVMIEGKAVTRDALKEGMIIGEDNGPKSWDKGRFKGIDHITMVVRDPKSNELMISQSRGGEGVELSSLDTYLSRKQANGVKLYATDPLAESRSLLKDNQQTQSQDPAAKTEAKKDPAPTRTAAAANADGVLERNEKGTAVRELQESLNKLGYRDAQGNALKPDGDFGKHTEESVRSFQKAHGLTVDGEAGPKTLEALKNAQKSPLLSDAKHPDHGMYEDALKGLEKLGANSGLKNAEERQRAAAGITYEARLGGLDKINHVVPNASGTGYFAVQGELGDPASKRALVDKATALSQPVERSTQQLAQDVPAQKPQTAPAQDAEQRQPAKPVLV